MVCGIYGRTLYYPFLVQLITNSFISFSFWASVFFRSSSSTVKLESNTMCWFMPLNDIILWQGGTKDAESETVFRLYELRKCLYDVWSGLTWKSVDTVSRLLFIPVGDDLSWWSKLSKAVIMNMSLEKWLGLVTRTFSHRISVCWAKSLFAFWTNL